MDDFSTWGSMLSDTMVKIAITALVAGAVYAVRRMWRDVGVLILSLVLETSVFITVTWVIVRARPDVMRLEESIVAWSRVYRGMHYLSDVTAGAALGVASVAAVWWIIHRLECDWTVAQ